jgi:hypothetical protein
LDEYTIIRTIELPHGRDWEWYPDANVVALAPHIVTETQRSQALFEVYRHWRRNCIQIVESPSLEVLPL